MQAQVVLDEAYIEFSEEASKMGWVADHPNLVVLRTFSKCAALAGLRVGYGAFPLGLIQYLWRAKQPYNVSVAAEVAAVAALSNLPYIERVRDALVAERARLFEGLQAVPYLQVSVCAEGGRAERSWKGGLEGRGRCRAAAGRPIQAAAAPCAALPLPRQLHPVPGDGRAGRARPQGRAGPAARHHGAPLQVRGRERFGGWCTGDCHVGAARSATPSTHVPSRPGRPPPSLPPSCPQHHGAEQQHPHLGGPARAHG